MKFRHLTLLLMLLTQNSIGQNLEDPCENNKDRIWVKTSEGNEASLSISKGKNRMLLAFSTRYFCLDKGADVMIIFTDNTSLTLNTINDFNCSSAFVYVYKKKDKQTLEYLSSKNIKTIKVYGVDKNMTAHINDEDSRSFTKAVKCMSNAI